MMETIMKKENVVVEGKEEADDQEEKAKSLIC